MTTESTTCAPNGVESTEMAPARPLNAADDVVVYLHQLKTAYTDRHQRSCNQHEQFMIEFHASQLEHAIELMSEVRDRMIAEILWTRSTTG